MASFFNTIMDRVRGLMGEEESGSVIGIDAGSAFLKVVQLKNKGGRAVLETYGEIALASYAESGVMGQATNLQPERISEALQDLIRESNVTTKQSSFAVSLNATLIAVIEMPAVSERELEKMVPIEARKYIPAPISEVTLDWRIIPESDDEEREDEDKKKKSKETFSILIVAIPNETIENYNAVIEQAGLQNRFMELGIFSVARSTIGHTLTPVAIFDMGAGTTKIAVLEGGVIQAQHIINRGSQDITHGLAKSMGITFEQAEQMKRDIGLLGKGKDSDVSETIRLTLDHMLAEANRTLLNYQRRNNKIIEEVILAGGGVLLPGFLDEANKAFETKSVYADPFSKTEAPAFLGPVLKEAGPEFAGATGLALRHLEELG